MSKTRVPRVVVQPETYRDLQIGINQLVNAVRPTLGPLPRIVAIEHQNRGKTPELLDNGGVIARRIVELPEQGVDVGAMFVRQVLWRVHEEVGDGTATTAVLFESVFNRGARYVVSGGNAMLLRGHLQNGMQLILDELEKMAVPVAGKEHLAQVAESICYDEPLATLLGEIIDIIGEHGQLEIRTGRGRELEREYVEGMYWDSGLLSREMITNHTELRAEIESAGVLISDLELQNPHQVARILEMAAQNGIRSLLIVARGISSAAMAVLLSVNQSSNSMQVIAVKTPGSVSVDQKGAMEDLGMLTGGRPLLQVAGDTLDGVSLADLGKARRVWANRDYVGIVGGRGDARKLRQHIATLRAAFGRAKEKDVRQRLRNRIGKLMGGSATLWVGGATEPEIKARKELAERTADALRAVAQEGVLPGGGVSLLACRPALQRRLELSRTSDERAAYHTLIKAMEAPIRTILTNAGHDASDVMAEIRIAGDGYGFDVRTGEVVDMAQAGIWDPAAVLRTAVSSAVSSAALALTTDVLVHHRKPIQATEP